MRPLARLWIWRARLLQRLPRSRPPREELIARFAPGRSFADIGCMWNVHGALAFLAEERGASRVTGLDLMAPTAEFEAEHARRGSHVRFICGDLHEPAVAAAVGVHDVVWCSGLLYHSPNPLLALGRLRSIAGQVLILATETAPEVPGLRQACVFYPGLGGADRRLHAAARPGAVALGVSTPFDLNQSYGAWWWGITPSAARAMLSATGFEVLEEHGGPLHRTFVARPA